jgi:hypothetical protein
VARQASPGIQTKATDEGVKTIAKVEVALQKKMKNGKCAWLKGTRFGAAGKNCGAKKWLRRPPAGDGSLLPEAQAVGGHHRNEDQELHSMDTSNRFNGKHGEHVHPGPQPEHSPSQEERIETSSRSIPPCSVMTISPNLQHQSVGRQRGQYVVRLPTDDRVVAAVTGGRWVSV